MNLFNRIAYDTGGYTVQEILSSFCKKILEIIDQVNKNEEVCNEARTILENIRNEVVPNVVDDIIKDMQDNGYFDSLVNVTLIENLRTELTTLLNDTITELTTSVDNVVKKDYINALNPPSPLSPISEDDSDIALKINDMFEIGKNIEILKLK